MQGNKLLESTAPPQRMSTGFAQLDEMLQGGLLRGSITEFAGPSNTCKTVVLSACQFLLKIIVTFKYHTFEIELNTRCSSSIH